MSPHDDVELLSAWRQRGDREAVDRLVRRHIHFVYASARRQVADPHLAEDVTQAVFMLLVTKSPRLPSTAALSVWLHNATRYASANARRMRLRRDHREREAARLGETEARASVSCDEYSDLVPMLDEAIGWLPRRDREGLILCFFRGCSYREIGSALGVTEEAARKRISRAVGRMRDFFATRGVVTSGAAVAACIAAESAAAAPPALLAASINVATVSHLAGAAGSTAIAKGVLHAMLLVKIKLAAAACAAVVVGGTLTAAAIQQAIAPAVVATLTMQAGDSFKTKVSDTLEVEFLGLAKWDAGAKGWFAIDGTQIDDPRGPFADEQLRARPQTTHQAMLHISGQQLAGGYAVHVPQAAAPPQLYDLTPSPDEAYLLVPFEAPNLKTVDIELRLADGEWKTIVSVDHQPGRPLGGHDTDYGGVVFTHVIDDPNGGSMVYVAHDIKGPQFEVFATDTQGNEHRAHNINGGAVGSFAAHRYDFGIQSENITQLSAKVRPFTRRVTAKGVTLDPAQPGKPEIVTDTIPPKK